MEMLAAFSSVGLLDRFKVHSSQTNASDLKWHSSQTNAEDVKWVLANAE
jgi:hypothetical protein